MSGTLAISWGRYGGFYLNARHPRTALRVCLGWVALTYVGVEIDELMHAYAAVPRPVTAEQDAGALR